MQRVNKEDIIKVMTDLKGKGYTQEELAVDLGRTQQTIWAWSSKAQPKRVPCKAEFDMLKNILKNIK